MFFILVNDSYSEDYLSHSSINYSSSEIGYDWDTFEPNRNETIKDQFQAYTCRRAVFDNRCIKGTTKLKLCPANSPNCVRNDTTEICSTATEIYEPLLGNDIFVQLCKDGKGDIQDESVAVDYNAIQETFSEDLTRQYVSILRKDDGSYIILVVGWNGTNSKWKVWTFNPTVTAGKFTELGSGVHNNDEISDVCANQSTMAYTLIQRDGEKIVYYRLTDPSYDELEE